MTRNLYQFNKEVSQDKWMVWFVFLVFTIPYGLASMIDVLVANSMEFWQGKNPIQPSSTTIYGEEGEIARATHNTDGSVDLTVIDADGKLQQVRFVREGETLAARDIAGRLIARVGDVNGQPQLLPAD